MKLNNLTGQRFGRLTVIERTTNDKNKNTRWICQCDCGEIIVVLGDNLRRKHTQSCGCLQKERVKQSKTKHGKTGTKLFGVWVGMKERCLNPNFKRYEDYGGRGITICDEWKNSFESFHDWAMANGYEEHLTIDRIDVNGNYEPSNCRWTTMKEQQNNRRNNHFITCNGETHTIAEWSNIVGISYQTLQNRINTRHWSIEKALTTPQRKWGVAS